MEWIVKTGQKVNVELVAHRGANGEAPENTISAFNICQVRDIDYVEIDIRSSLDGVLYNHHDKRLGRTSNGKGLFRLRRSSYIDSLDAGSWFSEDFAGEKIPRVEDILMAVGKRTKLFFDVKSCNLKKLLSLIKKYEMQDRCFFWFKKEHMVRSFRKTAPHMALKINCDTPERLSELKARYNPQIIECHLKNVSNKMVDECKNLGLKLMINYGEYDMERFNKALESGADMIVLDYPVKYLKDLQ
ncbi:MULTISPECIES: glycerophosphodiester phosphodiesterase family protein [unclassified Oceanispirochaeta]|uniref:glycerophosphodiester phosphodiesterase n=1 Tax=unclassified Oceanispirochaeta TaxID=2635722 RepID=UPI000E08D8F1|nr:MULTISPECIES: glycerophosphodiester phosphodiesterase family protein [unclassified Oceanispirochaeta]MBF9018258.1 glycerophosphodiester phosphodiesterase family protein [Oceanispirochaeta sp. M2]NPD74703.1 glycerophosphodiester phosphodiesterase family protein [Oceanispirochaeta sp. M1]RDG29430.1 hypothetical protein DV872_21605 [Oceanispirochaeta sp. M1]